MFRLASRVDSTEPSNWPFVRALMWFAPLAGELKLDDVTRPLGIAAASLVLMWMLILTSVYRQYVYASSRNPE